MRPVLTAVFSVLALSFSAQAAAPGAFTPFAGRWSGTLEYQDYGADKRVKIPVKLSVRVSSPGSAAWSFAYDDFGTTVNSLETHTWAAGTYTVSTLGKTEVQKYNSGDLAALLRTGVGKAVLLGKELENGKAVEVRRTLTLSKLNLSTLTETRTPGGTFRFRNLSTYTRQAD
jgi:hypothetical protein